MSPIIANAECFWKTPAYFNFRMPIIAAIPWELPHG
jgi:hypothetical protein